MARSLFVSQTVGLLIRVWHVQRRAPCNNVCNYAIPPLLLVLLTVLGRVLDPKDSSSVPIFKQQPLGGFAANPFPASQCANFIRDLKDPEAVAEKCIAGTGHTPADCIPCASTKLPSAFHRSTP
jgi:hypothetical protein